MSHVVDERIGELLLGAAQRGSCYVPSGDDAERIRRALSRRVADGAALSPGRGLFVDAEAWDSLKPAQRALWVARGLQTLHPDWVFCGPTAALAHGIDVSDALIADTHVAVPALRGGSNAGPLVRHPVLESCEPGGGIEEAGGLLVTPPLQTVFDCLRWTDFPHGLGVIDSALRVGAVCGDELAEHAERMAPRRRGARRALAALAWADPRSENGGESIARGRMLLLGDVRPELQVEVPRVVDRGEPYRADFCWVRADGLVILGELDGRLKYTEEEMMGGRDLGEVLSDENVRGSRFSLYDVSLMRFGFPVTERPAEFAAILDEYGVPKRGGPLALPEGTPMVPDWEALRRNRR